MSNNQLKSGSLRLDFKKKRPFLLNLMSSPGAGKTSLILKTIEAIYQDIRIGILEADINSKVETETIVNQGVQSVQIRTGDPCHLNTKAVAQGAEGLDFEILDLVILENTGNLICPSEFDTDRFINVMLFSIPEGDDKPLEYPLMFTVADVLILHKIDCLETSDFDLIAAIDRARRLNPKVQIFEVSSKTGKGVDNWAKWLKKEI